jgi:hypothetical protein
MATPYVTGPVHLFVGPLSSPNYLGTAERFPRMSIRTGWEPVFNDLGGQRVPFDLLYEGQEAFVSVDLTRWNENVLQVMMARAISTVPGLDGPLDIGTAMLTENAAGPLWLLFPFGGVKAAFNAPGSGPMPGGYRFPRAILAGPEDFESMGTAPRKIRLIWHCLRFFNPQNGRFLLYDNNMAGVVGIQRN